MDNPTMDHLESQNFGKNLLQFCANCLEPFLQMSITDNFDGGGGGGEKKEDKLEIENLIHLGIDGPPPSSSSIIQTTHNDIYRDFYIDQIIPTVDASEYDDDYDPLDYFSTDPSTTTTTTTRRKKIVIKDAVSEIYHLDYLNMFKNVEDNLDMNGDEEDVGFCCKCASLVKTMYSAYDEFNRLRRQNSHFYKKVQTLDRIMQKLQANFQQSTNCNDDDGQEMRIQLLDSQNNEDSQLFADYDSPIEPEEEDGCEVSFDLDKNETRTKIKLSKNINIVSENETPNNLVYTLTSSSVVPSGPPWVKLRRLTRREVVKYKPKTIRSRDKTLTTANDHFDGLADNEEFNEDDDYIPDEPAKVKSGSKIDRRHPRHKSEKVQMLKRKRMRKTKKKPTIKPVAVWKEFATIQPDITVEGEGEKKECKYMCKICDKVYTSVSGIKLHIHGHRGDRPFKCEHGDCLQSFMTKHAQSVHMMIHTGEKVQCTICGKFLSSPVNLSQHIKSLHEQIKRFLCSLCGRKFSNGTNLRRHLEIHSDLRRYKCQVCDKAFKQVHLLARHAKIHGEKTHLCPACGMGFTRGDTLKSHVTKHHSEEGVGV